MADTPPTKGAGGHRAGAGRKANPESKEKRRLREQAKFDADMNMRMANVHIVPNVKRKPIEDSPTNSPDVSDDEQEKDPVWGASEDTDAKRNELVPNRENIKDLCKSLKAEQRRQEKKGRKGSQQQGVLTTN